MGSNLFEPDSVMVPRTKSFIVKDRFGGVADLWVGDAFHSWFDEQRVLATGPSLITYCTLACRAFDKEIIEMLRTKGGQPFCLTCFILADAVENIYSECLVF